MNDHLVDDRDVKITGLLDQNETPAARARGTAHQRPASETLHGCRLPFPGCLEPMVYIKVGAYRTASATFEHDRFRFQNKNRSLALPAIA
jgi:hypothetical protein